MKAIVKNGVICPSEALPTDWPDGTEVEVHRATDIEKRFRCLEATWQAETRYHSNPRTIMGHPAMREIVAMGEAVVPIILRNLEAQTSLMVWALAEIAGEDLAPPEVEGGFAKWNIPAATQTWLQWGRAKGLL